MTYMCACACACFYLRVRVRVRACISTRTTMFGCSNVVCVDMCVCIVCMLRAFTIPSQHAHF